MKAYYNRRAPEYDDWWLGAGLHADRERPGCREEVDALIRALVMLPPARTLDVACGTGFLTQHLPGEVVGLDQSESMLEIARTRVPAAGFVRGDGIELPFSDDAFERLPSLSLRRWTWSAFTAPSGQKRGIRKQVSPPGACASTRKKSHIGADMNHLCPVMR